MIGDEEIDMIGMRARNSVIFVAVLGLANGTASVATGGTCVDGPPSELDVRVYEDTDGIIVSIGGVEVDPSLGIETHLKSKQYLDPNGLLTLDLATARLNNGQITIDRRAKTATTFLPQKISGAGHSETISLIQQAYERAYVACEKAAKDRLSLAKQSGTGVESAEKLNADVKARLKKSRKEFSTLFQGDLIDRVQLARVVNEIGITASMAGTEPRYYKSRDVGSRAWNEDRIFDSSSFPDVKMFDPEVSRPECFSLAKNVSGTLYGAPSGGSVSRPHGNAADRR